MANTKTICSVGLYCYWLFELFCLVKITGIIQKDDFIHLFLFIWVSWLHFASVSSLADLGGHCDHFTGQHQVCLIEMERSWDFWGSLKLIPLCLVKVAHLTGRMRGGEIDHSRVGVKYTCSSRPPGGAHKCVYVCDIQDSMQAPHTDERWQGAITPITPIWLKLEVHFFYRGLPHSHMSMFTTEDPNCQLRPLTEPHVSSIDRLAPTRLLLLLFLLLKSRNHKKGLGDIKQSDWLWHGRRF